AQDAQAIDANAIGAAQVAHDQIIVDLGDAAVPPRDLAGGQLDVALLVAPKQQDGFIEQDARAIGQRQELRGHESTHRGSATAFWERTSRIVFHADSESKGRLAKNAAPDATSFYRSWIQGTARISCAALVVGQASRLPGVGKARRLPYEHTLYTLRGQLPAA